MTFLIFLVLGSFFNVLIHRIPKGESIAFPPSHCPACKSRLKPLELIPVLSFVLQRGRCTHCGGRISWRYPLVELLTATLLSLTWYTWQGTPAVWAYLILTSFLIVISFIDIDTFLILDKVLLTGGALWLITQTIRPFITWREAFLGAVLGYAIMLLVYALSRGGMGFGDVKFALLFGLYLGPALTALSLLLGFVIGALVGVILLALKVKKRKDAIPFGPFLAIGAYLAMMWGADLIAWYLSTMGM